MRRIVAVAALLFALVPRAAHAGLLDPKGKAIDDFTIELEGRYWFGALSGDITADTGLVDGTSVDFPHTLGIDRPAKPLIEGVARLRLKKLIVRAAYFQGGWSEKTRIDETFTFKGISYTVGTEVKSRATIRVAALDAHFLLLDQGSGATFGLRVGAGIGGRYIGFKGAITEAISGISESTNGTGIIPVIGIDASVALFNLVSLNVDAAVMKIPTTTYLKIAGTFLDVSAGVRVYLHHFVYLTGGYRFVMLRASYHDRDVEVDSKLRGFFVGLGVSF